jgi:DNA-binding HxlR family transcriptional regulator
VSRSGVRDGGDYRPVSSSSTVMPRRVAGAKRAMGQFRTNIPDRDTTIAEQRAEWGTTVNHVLSVVGRKWIVSILVELLDGPRRHFQLRRGIHGVQSKVLRDNLRFLEEVGLVESVLHNDDVGGKSIAYQLTDLGRSLLVPLGALFAWGRDHLEDRRP